MVVFDAVMTSMMEEESVGGKAARGEGEGGRSGREDGALKERVERELAAAVRDRDRTGSVGSGWCC